MQSIQNHARHRFQAFARRRAAIQSGYAANAVQFESEQTPFPRTGCHLDLLLCTGFDSECVALFLCHIFTPRPMSDRKNECSDGRCFGRQQLLANSIENFISH